MVIYLYDHLERSSQEDYFYFRLGEFKHLYYCSSCTRSFDSKEKLDSCKFCNDVSASSILNTKQKSELIELKPDKKSNLLSDVKISKLIKDLKGLNLMKTLKLSASTINRQSRFSV